MRRPHAFMIGDKVLYFNVTLDHSHSGKFIPNGKDPLSFNKSYQMERTNCVHKRDNCYRPLLMEIC